MPAETEKWSQIMLKDQIPARAFHSAVFVLPSQQDPAMKVGSLPYLQKKMAKLNVERPKSSPGVRPSSIESQRSLQTIYLTQSASANTQAVKLNQRNQERPDHLLVNSSGSVESLKLHPSPAENVADELYLCPKSTDLNYNAYNFLDRNHLLHGIDNPGVSDSTEELIRQGRNAQLNDSREMLDDIKSRKSEWVLFRSTSCTCDEGNSGQALRQPVRMDSLPSDTSLVMDGLSDNLKPKKSKLDPELVLEDIENTDSFPFDVKLAHPGNFIGRSLSAYSVENMVLDSCDIETIELTDHARARSKSVGPEGVPIANGTMFSSVYFQSGKEKVCLRSHGGNEIMEQTLNKENTSKSALVNDKQSGSCCSGQKSDLDETSFSKCGKISQSDRIYKPNPNPFITSNSSKTSKVC